MADMSHSEDELLDLYQRAAFEYFIEQSNSQNGLVADRSQEGAPASIAVVGFAMSCYPVGVERGWITRAEAATRTLGTLRFFRNSPQGKEPDATGYKGFYYHFLDMRTGRRAWRSELSPIDTTLFLAGTLTAAAYFARDTPIEIEIRELADAIYLRVDWEWVCDRRARVRQGWMPESGFLPYFWEGYSEAILLYILGSASPSHPLCDDSFAAWTSTYQWKNIYDCELLYAGPLFIHHFPHAWIDFDGIQDRFMRERGSDYFENSRLAAYVQREYARRNPHEFEGYGKNCWGITASDGPGVKTLEIGGVKRHFLGYAARGAPYGPDDGSISPCAALGSLPFAPDIALLALKHFRLRYPDMISSSRLPSAFNPTLSGAGPAGWVSDGHFGLDQGIVVVMIENYRSRMIWKLMRESRYVVNGLRRVGFTGGWLS